MELFDLHIDREREGKGTKLGICHDTKVIKCSSVNCKWTVSLHNSE